METLKTWELGMLREVLCMDHDGDSTRLRDEVRQFIDACKSNGKNVVLVRAPGSPNMPVNLKLRIEITFDAETGAVSVGKDSKFVHVYCDYNMRSAGWRFARDAWTMAADKIKKVYGSYIRLLDTIERAVLKKHPGIPICWVYYTYKDGMKALKEDLDPPTIVRGMFKPRSDIIKEARAADAAAARSDDPRGSETSEMPSDATDAMSSRSSMYKTAEPNSQPSVASEGD